MVTICYCQDEPISSRAFELSAPDGILVGKFLFGDGQARGRAVRLAFQFLVNMARQSQYSIFGDPELMRIIEGLIQVPTVFTMSGESSTED